jgi:ligand-binding sensor domain-containing protein/class 3 adenylate cyclase
MKPFVQLILLSLFFSCSDVEVSKTATASSTRVVEAQGRALPKDVLKAPKVVQLVSMPKPQKIEVPVKTGGSYLKRDGKNEVKIDLVPPETKPVGVFYVMKSFTSEQGLALDGVNCGLTDSVGNIWFGTGGGGVSRYDGKTFTNYLAIQGLASDEIKAMLEDTSGNIWFGSRGSGVSKYDGKSFTTYSTTNGLSSNYVVSIAQDNAGNLWFGTSDGGVNKYDGKSFTRFSTTNGLASNKVTSIVRDKSGNLWFATDGGGISRYDGKSFKTFSTVDGLASNKVTSIREDTVGNLWFGTSDGGASKYDGRSFTTFSVLEGLASNSVTGIVEDKDRNLWFGTRESGVSKFDGKTFTNYSTEQGLSNNSIINIIEDKGGNLWFLSLTGINKFEGESFTRYTGFPPEQGNQIAEDKMGNLWFGTGGGLSKYEGRSLTNFTMAQGLISRGARSVLVDKAGNLWIGTTNGISKYDGTSFTNYTTEQGLASNSVWHILQDRVGHLWIATDGAGVSKFDGISFTNYTTEQGLASNNVFYIFEDKAGNLWFDTEGGEGVSRYDGASFTNFSKEQGLPGNNVYYTTEDKDGNLWFSASGGISRYDGKSFLTYSTKDGLPNTVGYWLETTRDEKIAIGTGQGLAILTHFVREPRNTRLPVHNKLSNEQLKDYTPVFEVFSTQTGYPFRDANTNSIHIDSHGFVWFGVGNKGIFRFDYAAVKRGQTPPVFIQGIKINNTKISWNHLLGNQKYDGSSVSPAEMEEITTFGYKLDATQINAMKKEFGNIGFNGVSKWYPVPQNLVLPYEHNQIEFGFGAIDTGHPENVLYQFRLEGFDKDWSPPDHRSSATYSNTFEGHYEFIVRAKGLYGDWSAPVSYKFQVLPPWYRTWWAYLIYAASTLTLLFLVYRWRTATLRARQRFLEIMYKAAERFVPKSFLDLIGKKHLENLELGDSVRKTITVLFNDIRNFTTLVESRQPEQAFKFANGYWAFMAPVIREYGGYIDQYQGDAILAIFPGSPENAKDCAIVMLAQLKLFNTAQKESNDIQIDIGIGLSTGTAMLGVLGEPERYVAGLMGDVANTAARIEGLNKLYGSHILLSGETRKELSPEGSLIRKVDKVYLKGKTAKTEIYEIVEWQDLLEDISLEIYLEHFYAAQQKYFDGDFVGALNGFQDCLKYNANDKVVIVLVKRCEEFLKSGSPKDWDGTFRMTEK